MFGILLTIYPGSHAIISVGYNSDFQSSAKLNPCSASKLGAERILALLDFNLGSPFGCELGLIW
jgi:hypothetical protein